MTCHWAIYTAVALLSYVIFQLADAEIHIIVLKPTNSLLGIQKNSDEYRGILIEKHDEILNSVKQLSKQNADAGASSTAKVYSYTEVLNGFSAELNEEQVTTLREREDVHGVFKTKILKPLTTRTYSFLGLDVVNGPWASTDCSNVTIGVFDTGVWPELSSFNDKGFGPIPAKFKGICQTGTNFTKKNCNRKLIGARFFGNSFSKSIGVPINSPDFPDIASPRDIDGHGSHTSSTAGGSVVPNVSIQNVTYGTARGMAFGARLAMYKVCWRGRTDDETGCYDADILAALDQAVLDGVDVFSLSLGGSPTELYLDSFSEATLNVALKGIPIVFSAGNSGPFSESVSNGYPWVMTVGASTLDRTFVNTVTLGSAAKFSGISVTAGTSPSNKLYPLINAASAFSPKFNSSFSQLCAPGSLSPIKVKGKIVLCLRGIFGRVDKSKEVLRAGGVGMILYNTPLWGNSLANCLPDYFVLPGSSMGYQDGLKIATYIQNTKNPTASLSAMAVISGSKRVEAPIVAGFSSVGPNYASYSILKPDIIAPGHSVIAAYSQSSKASFIPKNLFSEFYVASGTSMSCPHIAGIVALVKSKYPRWSPSQIFSAVMTSASVVNNRGQIIKNSFGQRATPFDMGAGHVSPIRALYPGLVYGISAQDYSNFLCSPSGWKNCSKNTREIDLNLPSLSLYQMNKTISTVRKLTLVGKPATYHANFSSPAGTQMTVTPRVLVFNKTGQTLSYKITVVPKVPYYNVTVDYFMYGFTFGSIAWSDGVHTVTINVAANVE